MPATERLYFEDSHLTEFTAHVIQVNAAANGQSAVTLDRTAFYPTGGGQPHDTGMLGTARVVDCIEGEADVVVHLVAGTAPSSGDKVSGVVDWPRRLDHLQQHTGQHHPVRRLC